MSGPTPMERHAALGPIAWTEGGMRATTRDGYEAEIEQSECDVGPAWIVRLAEPPLAGGRRWRNTAGCQDITAARALVACLIGYRRDQERWQREAKERLVEIAYRVMVEVERGLP